MAIPPPNVFDPEARERLLIAHLHRRGLSLDDTAPYDMALSAYIAQCANDIAHVCGDDPHRIRLAAALFGLWCQTFDELAPYADAELAESGEEIAADAAEFLRRNR